MGFARWLGLFWGVHLQQFVAEVTPVMTKKKLMNVAVDESGTPQETESKDNNTVAHEEDVDASETVEELFQKALEKESVKDTMKALMALDDASQDGRVDRTELEEILKTLFPSRHNYLARVDDYVRPGSRLPYVFDAITPEALSIEWSDSDVATIFARFDGDADGKIDKSEVVPQASDTGVLSRFAEFFLSSNTPQTDTRRMWSVLKNLSCTCAETDEAENFGMRVYAPCLADAALAVLESDVLHKAATSSNCKVDSKHPAVLTTSEFHQAAKPIFQFKQLASDLTFGNFRRFILEEPAEITHAISHLIYVGAHSAARALLLQQIMLASSDLFDSNGRSFNVDDARYRKMLHDRRSRELTDLALKIFGAAAAIGIFFYLLYALEVARNKHRNQRLAVAYLSGLAGLAAPLGPPLHAQPSRSDDHRHDDDDDEDLPIVLRHAFQAGQTDVKLRHRQDVDQVACDALAALHHELNGRTPNGTAPHFCISARPAASADRCNSQPETHGRTLAPSKRPL